MSNEIKTLTQEETAETKAPAHLPVLTVEKDEELMSEQEMQEIKWHELKNAYISKKILSGTLSGLETTPNDHRTIGIVYYNGYKISIPAAELIRLNSTGGDTNTRMEKIISSMIGAEISFMIIAIDNSSRSVIAPRLKANEKNIRTFYFDKNEQGRYKIYEGSIVEARITGVSLTSIRVEIFGAECNIQPAELSWDFIANAHDEYAIGEKVMVKVTSIRGRDNAEETFQITASICLAKSTAKEVIEMKLTNKVKANLTSAYMAGCMALSAATTANAADLSGVTNSVTSSVNDIVNVITPIAWAVVILDIVIMGCVLMWHSVSRDEKNSDKKLEEFFYIIIFLSNH